MSFDSPPWLECYIPTLGSETPWRALASAVVVVVFRHLGAESRRSHHELILGPNMSRSPSIFDAPIQLNRLTASTKMPCQKTTREYNL